MTIPGLAITAPGTDESVIYTSTQSGVPKLVGGANLLWHYGISQLEVVGSGSSGVVAQTLISKFSLQVVDRTTPANLYELSADGNIFHIYYNAVPGNKLTLDPAGNMTLLWTRRPSGATISASSNTSIQINRVGTGSVASTWWGINFQTPAADGNHILAVIGGSSWGSPWAAAGTLSLYCPTQFLIGSGRAYPIFGVDVLNARVVFNGMSTCGRS